MASCKDCVHFEVCTNFANMILDAFNVSEDDAQCLLKKCTGDATVCNDFADRSQFVELPCKVGDILFVPTRNFISEYKIDYFHVGAYGIWFNTTLIAGISTHLRSENIESIGKTVFLTREESEQALKERENNENQ